VEFHILGPVEVTHSRRSLAVGGARARALLAMLLLNANRVVSADRMADELWPGLGQERAAANLQVRLSELRRALRSVGESERLVTRPPGYLLQVTAEELDALRFEQLAAAGRQALAAGDAVGAVSLLDRALAPWQGPALADLADLPFAQAEAARLEEARLGVLESRVDAKLASGRHHEVHAELERPHAILARFRRPSTPTATASPLPTRFSAKGSSTSSPCPEWSAISTCGGRTPPLAGSSAGSPRSGG
jgi:DNA-binding SARP family transcriptional activator